MFDEVPQEPLWIPATVRTFLAETGWELISSGRQTYEKHPEHNYSHADYKRCDGYELELRDYKSESVVQVELWESGMYSTWDQGAQTARPLHTCQLRALRAMLKRWGFDKPPKED